MGSVIRRMANSAAAVVTSVRISMKAKTATANTVAADELRLRMISAELRSRCRV